MKTNKFKIHPVLLDYLNKVLLSHGRFMISDSHLKLVYYSLKSCFIILMLINSLLYINYKLLFFSIPRSILYQLGRRNCHTAVVWENLVEEKRSKIYFTSYIFSFVFFLLFYILTNLTIEVFHIYFYWLSVIRCQYF